MAKRTRRLVAALFLLWGAGTLVVLAFRLIVLVRAGAALPVTGLEACGIYGVWKADNGLPVYEEPFSWPYPFALFNFLFYETYGGLLRAAGVRGGDALVLGCRCITLLFAVVGTAGLVAAFRQALWPPGAPGGSTSARAPRRDGVLLLAAGVVSLTAFFGTNYTSWWTIAVRPDVAAGAMLAWAWAFLFKGVRTGRLGPYLWAGFFFALAWAFKQTFFLTAGSVVLYCVLVRRDFRNALGLALVPAVLAGAAILALRAHSPHYLENTLVAPAGETYRLGALLGVGVTALAQSPFVFLFPIAGLVWWRAGQWPADSGAAAGDQAAAGRTTDRPDRPGRLVLFAVLVLFLPSVAATGRVGGSRNYARRQPGSLQHGRQQREGRLPHLEALRQQHRDHAGREAGLKRQTPKR